MRIVVVGAGAVGGVVAANLALAGTPVVAVARGEHARAMSESGLRYESPTGTQVVELPVATSIAEVDVAADDVIMLGVKGQDTVSVLNDLRSAGVTDQPIVCMQNGVDNEPLIADRLGGDRVITGTVTTAVGKPGIGQVIEEKRRGIGIALSHPIGADIVSALNDAGLNGIGYAEPGPMKWSKLLTNLTGNATSAILDEPVTALFADRRLYEVEIAVLRECLAVMAALGFRPVDLPGTPVRALGGGRGDKMPSFHIDLHSGRGQTEVRFLNGAVVRYGAEHGVPTPVNAVLTETLEALSSGEQSLETYRHNPEALLARLR